MRVIVIAVALSVASAAHQTRSAQAAMDGCVTQDEAMRIVQTPPRETVGPAEAERVQRFAVANAWLEHCGLDWHPLFRALTAYHRQVGHRSETDMSRLTVWHGVWQGQTLAKLRRDKPACDDGLRQAARSNATRQLESLAPRQRS